MFKQFIQNLECLGYRVKSKILNAADYGDATTRERLFIIARRGNRPVNFPEPTHAKKPYTTVSGKRLKPWRTAREVIDWSLKGESVFNRKKPLAPNTMARIFAGLKKYSGLPFVLPHQHGWSNANNVRDIERPLPTFTATSSDMFVAEPYLVVLRNNADAKPLNDPVPTLCTARHIYLAEPYLIHVNHGEDKNGRRHQSMQKPLPTLTAKGSIGLIEPYLVKYYEGSDAASVDEPMPTITANYEHLGLCQPSVHPFSYRIADKSESDVNGEMEDDSIDHYQDERAQRLIDAFHGKKIEPFLVEYHGDHQGKQDGERRTRAVDAPLATVDTSNRFGIAEPFIVKFYGNGNAQSIDTPIGTLTTKDKFGLCIPQLGAVLDIRFRMLQPHELAAAMSFPKSYSFAGTREQKVRQIGNAVPVALAEALCRTLIEKPVRQVRKKTA